MLCLVVAVPLRAETVTVGVASNFTHTLREIVVVFEAETGHRVRMSPSSSGKLFAQIMNGAPYDVFLSADAERPERLEVAGRIVAGSRFTFATGQLTLWATDPRYAGADCPAEIRAGNFSRVAIANPATAPYGAAAEQVLAQFGYQRPALRGRLALGENIAQTLQFVVSGGASIAIIARSQLAIDSLPEATCRWDVPPSMHLPLVQQAVLLPRGAANPAAVALLSFLRGDAARAVMRAHGYLVDE